MISGNSLDKVVSFLFVAWLTTLAGTLLTVSVLLLNEVRLALGFTGRAEVDQIHKRPAKIILAKLDSRESCANLD